MAGLLAVRIIGIDPGPTPGLVALYVFDGEIAHVDVVQATPGAAVAALEAILDVPGWPRTLVQVEAFVVRGVSAKTGRAGAVTRDQVGQFTATAAAKDAKVTQRAAGHVKPWATDARLAAAGLLDPTKGMRHARDAARHALFCAVKDGGVPDPLSTRNEPREEATS